MCFSRYDLRSKEMIDELQHFLFEDTEPFLCELLCFAQSSFDMEHYDRYVLYEAGSNPTG
jgi:hypothetical protein